MTKQSDSELFGRIQLRQALRLWHNTADLGQLPLTQHRLIEQHRRQAALPASDNGRGMALRQVLLDVLDQLRSNSSEDSGRDKRWRYHFILTEQFVKQFSPDFVASQLHVSKRTYFRDQNRAIDAVAEQLSQRALQQDVPQAQQEPSELDATANWDQAAYEAMAAAQEARKQFDVATALRFYEQAIALVENSVDSPQKTTQLRAALDGRGWCLRMHGRMTAYAADSQRLLELAQKSADMSDVAYAFWRNAYAARWFGDYGMARETAFRGIRAARDAESRLQLARCWREVGVSSRLLGDNEQARFAFSEAIYAFAAVGDVVSEVHALGNLATLAIRIGENALAVSHADTALALCERQGLTYERRLALGDRGAALLAEEPDEAERCLLASKTIAAQIADRTQLVFCDGHLGWLFLQRRQADLAEKYFAAGLARAHAFGSSAEISWLQSGLAETLFHQKRYDRAAKHVVLALEQAQQRQLAYETRLALQIKDRISRFVAV